MADMAEWQRDGWAPNGPGHCRCPICGTTVSTNALARAAHCRGKKHQAAIEERQQRRNHDEKLG